VESATHQAHCIEDGVVRICGCLVHGLIPDKSHFVRKSHTCRDGAEDPQLAVYPHPSPCVGRAEVDADCSWHFATVSVCKMQMTEFWSGKFYSESQSVILLSWNARQKGCAMCCFITTSTI